MSNLGLQKNQFDEHGDLLADVSANAGWTKTKTKRGRIWLVGEREPREISFKQLQSLFELKHKTNPPKEVSIKELNLAVRLDDIRRMESFEKTETSTTELSGLPTKTIFAIYEGEVSPECYLKIDDRPKYEIERTGADYWRAKIHYRETENGERLFLKVGEAPNLMLMRSHDGYPYSVGAVFEYGVRVV